MTTQRQYCIFRWTGSPLEDWLNISNMFMQLLLDWTKSSYHHNIHLSTPTLIVWGLQWRSLNADTIPQRPRGNPNGGLSHSSSDASCGSHMTTQSLWQTFVVIGTCTHMCLTQGEIVSGLTTSARITAAYPSQLILTHMHPLSDLTPCWLTSQWP